MKINILIRLALRISSKRIGSKHFKKRVTRSPWLVFLIHYKAVLIINKNNNNKQNKIMFMRLLLVYSSLW